MHTKPCIASLAFTAHNLQYRLDITTKESFLFPKRDGAIK